jgi:SAM-dependent methyltransferase
MSEVMSEPGCLLCGGATDIVLDGVADLRFGAPGTWHISRCQRCGLEQTGPRPTGPELKTLYETFYNYGGESGTNYTGWRDRFFASPLYRLVLKIDGDMSFHEERGSGRLLDVGCNEGRNLVFYRQAGFKPEGLELNAHAAEAARRRGFMVYESDLTQLKPSLPFDRVVLSNVLEHMLDPRATLAAVKRLLVPGGEVWISLPNRDSWQRALFGRRWINWHVPFHIAHFDAESLARLLTEAGFEVTSLRHISPAQWAAQSAIAAIFPAQPRAHRSVPLVGALMLLIRGLLFPLLWLGNRAGRGDCLVIKARRR